MSILFAQLARKHRGGALLVLRFLIPMVAVTSIAISLVTIPTAFSASTSTTAIMEVYMVAVRRRRLREGWRCNRQAQPCRGNTLLIVR
jgi:hypothetical protein